MDAVLLVVHGRRDDPRRVPRAVRSVQRDGERCNATASVARNAGNDGTGQYDNAGNYTFGGFGAGFWSKEACCEDLRNDCSPLGFCVDQTASQDFLFGLWMPGRADSAGPHRFLPTDADTAYQRAGPDRWPQWGNYGDDLNMGDNGPLGGSAGRCDPGVTGCARAPWATRLRTRRRAWWIRATGRPAPATAAATRTSIPARAYATLDGDPRCIPLAVRPVQCDGERGAQRGRIWH